MSINRRNILKTAALGAAGLPLMANAATMNETAGKKLKILVAGGHPDDPETGCGGTMAAYAKAGHEVVSLYLTTGEGGIPGTGPDEAAAIRKKEAIKACEILGCSPVFAGQIDGDTQVNKTWYDKIRLILEKEKPDIVYTHWPIDTHRDHRAISLLVYDAWLRMNKSFTLFYFEVLSGAQTQHFHPTHFVDISETEAIKEKACRAHVSQNPDDFYPYHQEMSRFRGLEARYKHAEAFVMHVQSGKIAF